MALPTTTAEGIVVRGAVPGSVVIFVLVIGGYFVVISFLGGFASAVAAGGREDRSLLGNFAIGLAGWLGGSAVWWAMTGEWPQEISIGMIVLTFLTAVIIAVVVDRVRQRRANGARS